MDLVDVRNAIEIAGFSKEVNMKIWEKERKAFEVRKK